MREAGLFLAHLEAGAGGGIVGQRAAQDILPVGFLFSRSLLHILAHPVADFAVGDGVFHDVDKLLLAQAGGFEPEPVETFAEVFLVIGVEFAGEAG